MSAQVAGDPTIRGQQEHRGFSLQNIVIGQVPLKVNPALPVRDRSGHNGALGDRSPKEKGRQKNNMRLCLMISSISNTLNILIDLYPYASRNRGLRI